MYTVIRNWFYLVTVIALFTACSKETYVEREIKSNMLAAVNALRQSGCTCGSTQMPPVKPLIWNDTLANAALAHARDMDANNYFSHISPGGTSPIQRVIAVGYTGKYVLENIAKGYSSVEPVIQAWRQSEEHCKAMMDSLPMVMGAGNVNSYWVLELGR